MCETFFADCDEKSKKYIQKIKDKYARYASKNDVDDVPADKQIRWSTAWHKNWNIWYTKYVSISSGRPVGLIAGGPLYPFPLCDYEGFKYASFYITGCLGKNVNFEIIKPRKSKKGLFYWNKQLLGWIQKDTSLTGFSRLRLVHLLFNASGEKMGRLNSTFFHGWVWQTDHGRFQLTNNSNGETIPLTDVPEWQLFLMGMTTSYLLSRYGGG